MENSGKSIVVNTSPWIALSICGQIPLLKKIYDDIYVPFGVKEELLAGAEQDIGANDLRSSQWVHIEKVIDNEKVRLLYELDRGEAEVIILAKEKGIPCVLIDEKVARLQARILGLEVIGTLGLLLKAKKMGALPSLRPLMKKMIDNGSWIKNDLGQGILTEAGEKW